jgi:uncharacterized membrane protein YfcA
MSIEIIIIGSLVGFLVGLTGVGGAALLTPILLWLGINPVIAVGTDLIYNSVTKFFGALQHMKQKTVNKKLVFYLSIGSVPGAVIAISIFYLFEPFTFNSEVIIRQGIGYILVFTSLLTFYHTYFFKENKKESRMFQREERSLFTIGLGVVLGFIVGLTSVGSGTLFAVAMLMFYHIQTKKLVGTDIAHAFILVTVAGFLHAGIGNVNWLLAMNLLIGSIPGVLLGSRLSYRLPTKPLLTIMLVFIFLSGLKFIF